MIPKIIHYCWFGGKPMPEYQVKYIDLWKKKLPDYKIVCWNESNIDIESIPFLKQAYDAKMWAFVADYARLYAIYQMGGIYMDTDVEVLKTFDEYLSHSFFTSYEYHPAYSHMRTIHEMLDENGIRRPGVDPMKKIPGIGLMSAIIAGEKGSVYVKDLLNWYDNMSFEENREKNYTIPTTLAITAERYGFRYVNQFQLLEGNIAIYPSDIFADYRTSSKNSVAIHKCTGSWSKGGSLFHKYWYKCYKNKWFRYIYQTIRNKFEEYPIVY